MNMKALRHAFFSGSFSIQSFNALCSKALQFLPEDMHQIDTRIMFRSSISQVALSLLSEWLYVTGKEAITAVFTIFASVRSGVTFSMNLFPVTNAVCGGVF